MRKNENSPKRKKVIIKKKISSPRRKTSPVKKKKRMVISPKREKKTRLNPPRRAGGYRTRDYTRRDVSRGIFSRGDRRDYSDLRAFENISRGSCVGVCVVEYANASRDAYEQALNRERQIAGGSSFTAFVRALTSGSREAFLDIDRGVRAAGSAGVSGARAVERGALAVGRKVSDSEVGRKFKRTTGYERTIKGSLFAGSITSKKEELLKKINKYDKMVRQPFALEGGSSCGNNFDTEPFSRYPAKVKDLAKQICKIFPLNGVEIINSRGTTTTINIPKLNNASGLKDVYLKIVQRADAASSRGMGGVSILNYEYKNMETLVNVFGNKVDDTYDTWKYIKENKDETWSGYTLFDKEKKEYKEQKKSIKSSEAIKEKYNKKRRTIVDFLGKLTETELFEPINPAGNDLKIIKNVILGFLLDAVIYDVNDRNAIDAMIPRNDVFIDSVGLKIRLDNVLDRFPEYTGEIFSEHFNEKKNKEIEFLDERIEETKTLETYLKTVRTAKYMNTKEMTELLNTFGLTKILEIVKKFSDLEDIKKKYVKQLDKYKLDALVDGNDEDDGGKAIKQNMITILDKIIIPENFFRDLTWKNLEDKYQVLRNLGSADNNSYKDFMERINILIETYNIYQKCKELLKEIGKKKTEIDDKKGAIVAIESNKIDKKALIDKIKDKLTPEIDKSNQKYTVALQKMGDIKRRLEQRRRTLDQSTKDLLNDEKVEVEKDYNELKTINDELDKIVKTIDDGIKAMGKIIEAADIESEAKNILSQEEIKDALESVDLESLKQERNRKIDELLSAIGDLKNDLSLCQETIDRGNLITLWKKEAIQILARLINHITTEYFDKFTEEIQQIRIDFPDQNNLKTIKNFKVLFDKLSLIQTQMCIFVNDIVVLDEETEYKEAVDIIGDSKTSWNNSFDIPRDTTTITEGEIISLQKIIVKNILAKLDSAYTNYVDTIELCSSQISEAGGDTGTDNRTEKLKHLAIKFLGKIVNHVFRDYLAEIATRSEEITRSLDSTNDSVEWSDLIEETEDLNVKFRNISKIPKKLCEYIYDISGLPDNISVDLIKNILKRANKYIEDNFKTITDNDPNDSFRITSEEFNELTSAAFIPLADNSDATVASDSDSESESESEPDTGSNQQNWGEYLSSFF